MRTFLVWTVLCMSTATVQAANQTPGSTEAALFLPWGQDGTLAPLDDSAEQAFELSGYNVSRHEQTSATLNPSVRITTLTNILTGTVGVFHGVSHGDSTSDGASFGAEVYEYSDAGFDSAFAAMNEYVAWGYHSSYLEIAQDVNNTGWAINVRAGYLSFVSRTGVNRIAILIASSCASLIPSFQGRWGAGVKTGSAVSPADLTTLFVRLTGGEGLDKRPTGVAIVGLSTLRGWGNGETVLCPRVAAQSHSDYAAIGSETDMWIDFDCAMDTGRYPLDQSGLIRVLTNNRLWTSGGTRFAFKVVPLGIGSGTIYVVQNQAVSPGGLPLNGGQFDHRIQLTTTGGDNGAASISGFHVTDGVASFLAESEWGTAGYRIEGRATLNDPYVPLVSLTADGAGPYSVAVPPAASYQLLETEVSGRTLKQAETEPGPPPSPPETLTFDVAALRQKIATMLALIQAGSGEQPTGVRRCLYVAPAAWEQDLEPVMSLGEGRGYGRIFLASETLGSDPATFRAQLLAQIASESPNTDLSVLLVGSSNDFEQMFDDWQTWWPAGGWQTVRQGYLDQGYVRQAERDIVPTWYVADLRPQPDGMSWFRPYYDTDFPYSDWTGDGIPDVVVARAPVATQAELVAWIANVLEFEYVPRPPQRIGVWANDSDWLGNSGLFVADLVDTQVLPNVPADYVPNVLWTSQIGGFHSLREAAIRSQVGSGVETIVTLATISTRYRTGDFHRETFAVTSIPFSPRFVMIGTTCDVGGFNRTHNPSYGVPVGVRFLTAQDRGAIAWIAPSAGTWQEGDAVVAETLLQQVYGNRQRALARSFLEAQKVILASRPDLRDLVQSFGFFGCPFTHLSTNGVPTDALMVPRQTFLYPNVPNPFNATTEIRFSVGASGRAIVDVYDVRGARIRRLFDGLAPTGQLQRLVWVGTDEVGRRVSSGVYIVHLNAGGTSIAHKLTLLK